MAAGNYDIFCDLNESFSQTFQYLNENMEFIDISNYIIHFKVKITATTTEEYMFEVYSEERLPQEGSISFSSTDIIEYGTIEKLNDGKFILKLYNETMQSLKQGYYFYNLRLIGTDDSITSLIKGRFVVQSEVQ